MKTGALLSRAAGIGMHILWPGVAPDLRSTVVNGHRITATLTAGGKPMYQMGGVWSPDRDRIIKMAGLLEPGEFTQPAHVERVHLDA